MGVLYPLETLIANFFVKQAVRFRLGTDYLGLQNVYTNFCDILTFAFAGFGIAMMFRLYRPIEEGNEETVRKLFHYFERIYTWFVSGAAGVGVLLTGVVIWSVKTDLIPLWEVILGYFLYLISSLIYNRFYIYYFYLSAWQKRYAACIIHSATDLAALVIEIGSLYLFKNYMIFLGCIILKNIVEAAIIYTYSLRRYPFLKVKETEKNPPETKGALSDVRHMIITKIGNLLVGSTDSILISGLVSTFAAGCYSGYYFIYLGLTTVTSSFYESIMNRVGKQLVSRHPERRFRHFIKISVLNIAIAAAVVSGFYWLCDDFIVLWMGKELLLGRDIVTLVSINLFMCISRHSVSIYRQSAGLFDKASRVILAWGILNLILSAVFGSFWGMFGILLATSVSNFLTIYWYEPYIVYKFFGKSFKFAIFYELAVLAAAFSTVYIDGLVISLIPASGWLMLIVKTAALVALSALWLGIIAGIPYYFYLKRQKSIIPSEGEGGELISAVVPVYNVREYLSGCLDSILSQTYKNFELILVDDGSNDGGERLCDEYALKDPRIRVIHQENKGLSSARNAGKAAAEGKYITFIDSDDIVHPRYLACLYEELKESGAEVSVTGYRTFKKEKAFYSRLSEGEDTEVISGREASERIIKGHETKMITACGKLYDMKLKGLLEFPEGKLHEDDFTTYKVLYACERVAVGSERLYGMREREGSITSVYDERRLDKLEALKECIEWAKEKGEEELCGYAKVRYILNLEIAWYNVNTRMKGAKAIEERLISEHRETVKSCWQQLRPLAGLSDRAAVAIFERSPSLYRAFARGYALTVKGRDS